VPTTIIEDDGLHFEPAHFPAAKGREFGAGGRVHGFRRTVREELQRRIGVRYACGGNIGGTAPSNCPISL